MGRVPALTILALALAACALPTPPGFEVGVAVMDEPATLNPLVATDEWSLRVLDLLFEPPYAYGPDLTLVPLLACGPPSLVNDTIIVRLREGLRWSDGTPLTAEDAAFTLNALLSLKPEHLSDALAYLRGARAADPLTVEVKVNPRGSVLVLSQLLTLPVVQKRQWEPLVREALGKDDPVEWLLGRWPADLACSGPFALEGWEGGNLVLARNPFYHGPAPGPERVVLRVYRSLDHALVGLRKGEVDYVWTPLGPGYADVLRGEPGMVLSVSPGRRLYYLAFNLDRSPLNDPNFRRAVAELVNKSFLVGTLLRGYGEAESSMVPGWDAGWHFPLRKAGGGLESARAVLAGANYTWTNGTLAHGGVPLKELVVLVPQDPLLYGTAMVVQSWLRDLGVPSRVRFLPLHRFVEEVYGERDFDTYLHWVEVGVEPVHLWSMFHSRHVGGGEANAMGYRSPEFDRLAGAYIGEWNASRRRALALEMQRVLARDLPCVPLFTAHVVEVRSARVKGWVPMPGGVGNRWSFLSLTPRG